MIYKMTHIALIMFFATPPALAAVIEFTDKAEWESAVGGFTTLDFVLPPSSTPISDQYAHLGVNFSGVLFSHNSASAYPNDGWGLRSVSNTGGAWAHFDTPQNWIAVDHPGSIRFELYRDGKSIYLSSNFATSGVGNFAGLLSTEAFDEIHLFRVHPQSSSSIFIDDLHFGTFVPGPGGLALLALAGFAGRSRRRA